MKNRDDIEGKMLKSISDSHEKFENVDDNEETFIDEMLNLSKASKECADVAIQYAIDVLTNVACFASLKEDADIIHNKISELQSLLKQPQP